jgi:hypothetical protein
VLTVTEIAGFIGVRLAGAAYIPQIWHLVRVHCAAGISRFAFCLWLGATLLVTTNAIATRATVFILLGVVQSVATALILLYTTKYRSTYCAGHMPVDLGAETEQGLIDEQTGGPSREKLSVGSASSTDGSVPWMRHEVLAEDLFRFRWPGPGNSEGPVDPDRWLQVETKDPSAKGSSSDTPLSASPWAGQGDSEA